MIYIKENHNNFNIAYMEPTQKIPVCLHYCKDGGNTVTLWNVDYGSDKTTELTQSFRKK